MYINPLVVFLIILLIVGCTGNNKHSDCSTSCEGWIGLSLLTGGVYVLGWIVFIVGIITFDYYSNKKMEREYKVNYGYCVDGEIYVNAEGIDLFTKAGQSKEKVKATVDHYRQQGLTDEQILTKINKKLNYLNNRKSVRD